MVAVGYLCDIQTIEKAVKGAFCKLPSNVRCIVIPGAARLGRRPTGVARSKITRVLVLSWPLPVLTNLYFLTVTKSCHTKFPMKCDERLVFVVAEVASNQFKAIKKIFLSTVVITKNYMSNRCFP